MPTVGVAGTRLNYERAGDGAPLLLIQGMGGTHLSWGEPFLGRLRRDFDCINFDNRGIGRSSPVETPFAIADLAADALGLLDALETESAHVVGISMGGMVAQELALADPVRVRSLTIGCSYCGGAGSRLMDAAVFGPLAEAMASGDRERVLRASWEVNLSPGFRAEQSHFAAFEEMAAALPISRGILGLQLQAIFNHDTSERLPGIDLPTLVVHGTVDRVLPVENGRQIAALIPGSRLQTFDEVGHMFWWEQPERSADLVRAHALSSD